MSKITQSARGERCQIRFPGICNHDPETTVSRITVWRAIAARASSRPTLWARMPVRAVTIWPTGG